MDLLCKNITRCYHQNYNAKLQTMTCGWIRAEDCSQCVKNESISMWKEQLKKVEQFPQRQDSLVEQMYDLHAIANKFGLYDAADSIKRRFMEKRCIIGMDYEKCSSREYGQSCLDCVNFR